MGEKALQSERPEIRVLRISPIFHSNLLCKSLFSVKLYDTIFVHSQRERERETRRAAAHAQITLIVQVGE